LLSSVFLLDLSAFAADVKIAGRAAVLMDSRTGKILWQRNPDLALAPASTTKILTALVVLDRSETNDMVTVTAEATKATGGSARIRTSEQLSVEQLLYGMLLGSANDAAIALANHAGGSVARFVDLMNGKARSLDARRSSFRNPTGLPQQGHLTTARDLALITRAALANSVLRKIVAARSYRWHSANWQGQLKNANRLLESYSGAIGVKTGQTSEAGFCLVAAAARGEESLIAVILKSTEQAVWQDARNLLEHGFKNGRVK
jgi:D-alanyl-D-alanine carboxypeptidase (penicillin-binding protein 5/6)